MGLPTSESGRESDVPKIEHCCFLCYSHLAKANQTRLIFVVTLPNIVMDCKEKIKVKPVVR